MIYHKKVQTYALINNYLRSYSDKFGLNILFFYMTPWIIGCFRICLNYLCMYSFSKREAVSLFKLEAKANSLYKI